MELVKIKDDRKTLYMDLLLIADEDVRMIEKYLSRGEMFALCDGDLKAPLVDPHDMPQVSLSIASDLRVIFLGF